MSGQYEESNVAVRHQHRRNGQGREVVFDWDNGHDDNHSRRGKNLAVTPRVRSCSSCLNIHGRLNGVLNLNELPLYSGPAWHSDNDEEQDDVFLNDDSEGYAFGRGNGGISPEEGSGQSGRESLGRNMSSPLICLFQRKPSIRSPPLRPSIPSLDAITNNSVRSTVAAGRSTRQEGNLVFTSGLNYAATGGRVENTRKRTVGTGSMNTLPTNGRDSEPNHSIANMLNRIDQGGRHILFGRMQEFRPVRFHDAQNTFQQASQVIHRPVPRHGNIAGGSDIPEPEVYDDDRMTDSNSTPQAQNLNGPMNSLVYTGFYMTPLGTIGRQESALHSDQAGSRFGQGAPGFHILPFAERFAFSSPSVNRAMDWRINNEEYRFLRSNGNFQRRRASSIDVENLARFPECRQELNELPTNANLPSGSTHNTVNIEFPFLPMN